MGEGGRRKEGGALCSLVLCVLFVLLVSCRAVPVPVLSCVSLSFFVCLFVSPSSVLRSVCLLCEALDSPNGFMFFLLVTVSSTFLVSCPARFVKKGVA